MPKECSISNCSHALSLSPFLWTTKPVLFIHCIPLHSRSRLGMRLKSWQCSQKIKHGYTCSLLWLTDNLSHNKSVSLWTCCDVCRSKLLSVVVPKSLHPPQTLFFSSSSSSSWTKELVGAIMKGKPRSLSCQERCSRESRHDFMANDSLTNINVGCSEDNQVELS